MQSDQTRIGLRTTYLIFEGARRLVDGKISHVDSKNVVLFIEKFVPEAFKEFGVSIDDFDVKNRHIRGRFIWKRYRCRRIGASDELSVPGERLRIREGRRSFRRSNIQRRVSGNS